MSQSRDESEAMHRFSSEDANVIYECLIAAVDGPFFPDWEFQIFFGLARDEVRQTAAEWPATWNAETQDIAVTNAMNNLLGYLHGKWDAWPQYISVAPTRVREILARWLGTEIDNNRKGYFDRLR